MIALLAEARADPEASSVGFGGLVALHRKSSMPRDGTEFVAEAGLPLSLLAVDLAACSGRPSQNCTAGTDSFGFAWAVRLILP